jgi:small subunit ribosomal protein S1
VTGKDDDSFAALFERSGEANTKQRRYHTGERVEVRVVAVSQTSVFADLGGKQEGYFERVELVDAEGKLTVEVGARVSATVAGIDRGTGQVKLSPVFVRASDDPTAHAASQPAARPGGPVVVEGARVKGKVTGVERYGVFVQIDGTNGRQGRGLVPVSETATPRGADLKKHFANGQDVEAKILAIDAEGKIRLSIKALAADDERREYESFQKAPTESSAEGAEAAAPAAGKKGGAPKKPEPRGFGTLGDLLSKKAPKR